MKQQLLALFFEQVALTKRRKWEGETTLCRCF